MVVIETITRRDRHVEEKMSGSKFFFLTDDFLYSLTVYNIFLPHSFWLHLYCQHSRDFYYSLLVYNIFYRTLFGCTSIVCTPMIFTIAL